MVSSSSLINPLRTVITLAPGMSKTEIDWLVRCENACNRATKDFLAQKIDQETWLDTLEFFGHSIDEYGQVTEENLMVMGF